MNMAVVYDKVTDAKTITQTYAILCNFISDIKLETSPTKRVLSIAFIIFTCL